MTLKKTSTAILSGSIKIVVYLLLGVVVYMVLSKSFEFGELIFSDKGMAPKGSGVEVQITIPNGASDKEIGDILVKNGLSENAYAFVVQTILYEADIKPGKYILNTEYSPKEIIDILVTETVSEEE